MQEGLGGLSNTNTNLIYQEMLALITAVHEWNHKVISVFCTFCGCDTDTCIQIGTSNQAKSHLLPQIMTIWN